MNAVETIRRVTLQARTDGYDAAAALLDRFAKAADGVAVAADRQERAILSNQNAIDRASRSYTPLFAAQEKLTKLSRELEMGQAAGRISLDASNALYAQAVDKLTGYSRAVEQATRAEIQLRAAQENTARQTASNSQRNIGLNLGFRQAPDVEARGADFEAAALAADRLRSKYDQVFAAAQGYGAGLAEINALQRAGIITSDLATAARDKETLAYERQIHALDSVARLTAASSQRNIGLNLGFREAPDIEVRGADMLAAIEDQDRLRAKYDQTFAAEQKLAAATREINALQASGGVDASAAARLIQTETDAYNRQIATLNGTTAAQEALARAAKAQSAASADAARNAAEGWRKLGSSGEDVLRTQASVSRLSNLSSDGSVAQISKAAASRRLRPDEAQNLTAQAIDVGVSLQGGMNPLTVLMQQGGQVAPIFAGPGGASVKGAFEQASEAATKFLGRIGPTGAVIAGITTAAVTGAAALLSYASSQKELEKNLSGQGRASGATVGLINAMAPDSARAAGVSTAAAREMAGAFASTGRIGVEMYSGLTKEVRAYSIMTGTEATDSTRIFAEAFADPAAGALELNKSLGFLNAGMLENIRSMQASGDRLGAQKLLMQGVASATVDANAKLGFFARQWSEFRTNTSNEVDAIGGFLSKGFGLDDAEARLKTLQGQLQFRQNRKGSMGGLFDGLWGFDEDQIRSDIAKAEAEIAKATAANKKSADDQRGVEINDLVRSLNPSTVALEAMENSAKGIRDHFAKLGVDPFGPAKLAMQGLETSAKQIRADMAAGGAAYADAIRAAQFGNRTVGFTQQGLSAAQINEDAKNRDIEALRNAKNDTTAETYLKAAQSNEAERILRLDTLAKTVTEAEVKLGGAFSRFSTDVQKQIVSAASGSGSVSASLIAAIAGKESTGDANVGFAKSLGADGRRSTSYGLGQINEGTAADAIRRGFLPRDYDRMDTSRGAEGIAGVLKMKLADAGGDEDRAIMNYFGNPSEAANRKYLLDIRRKQGLMGDISEGGQAKDYDALARAQRDAGQSLEQLQKNYGKNGQALELAQAQQAKYNELLDKGYTAQQAANVAYGDMTRKIVEFGQSAKMVQFASDNQFNREQLGRSASDQNAYAQARSRIGDTTSPEAQRMIADIKETNDLVDAKNSASSALSGFAQDLAHGATAAQAASSALSRLADSVLNKVIDSLVSSAFGSVAKGGLSSLFGFADGGIMTSNGPLPLHSYATGGIANSPQLALFGEGRGPEAFVPLPDGKRIPVAMSGPANSNSAPAQTDARVFNMDLRGSTLTRGEVQSAIAQALSVSNAENRRTIGQQFSAWKEDN